MRSALLAILILFSSFQVFSQISTPIPDPTNQKGKFYFYFGWNRAWYSNSNIHFNGSNYNFTLHDVKAADRPTPLNAETYFNPKNLTIPQYDFRTGYFINNHYNISLGYDHMKYVMVQNQMAKITGDIHDTQSGFDGDYINQDLKLTRNFLQFEHTNGLNYCNIDVRRFDFILDHPYLKIGLTEGMGGGMVYTKTDATLLNNDRNDQWHVSGYGFSAMAGLQATFYTLFFIQMEYKAGFINLPDIKTTHFATDHADQHFFFSQLNFCLGSYISVKRSLPAKTSTQ